MPTNSSVAWLTRNGRASGSRIRVEGDDLGAELGGPLHRLDDRLRIARRHRDGWDVAVSKVVDDVDLRLWARLRRAVVVRRAADLAGGHPRASQRRVVVRVGGLLDDHCEFEVVGERGGGAAQQTRRRECGD